MDKNIHRHVQLSIMLSKMGRALIEEGKEAADTNISMSGSILVFLAGLIQDKKELLMLGEMCNMVSCKKLIDSVQANEVDKKNVYSMGDIERLNLSNEELLDVIRKLRIQFGLDNDDSNEKN